MMVVEEQVLLGVLDAAASRGELPASEMAAVWPVRVAELVVGAAARVAGLRLAGDEVAAAAERIVSAVELHELTKEYR